MVTELLIVEVKM